jgi:streptogramin lyase
MRSMTTLCAALAASVMSLGAAGSGQTLTDERSYDFGDTFSFNQFVLSQDGVLWIADGNTRDHAILKIDKAGKLSTFALPADLSVVGLAVGEHGEMWGISASGEEPALSESIVHIAANGDVQKYPAGSAELSAIVVGPDRRPWFASAGAREATILRLGADGAILKMGTIDGALISSMVAGPDGNVWYTDTVGNRIGRISSSGQVALYPTPQKGGEPNSIVLGPDAKLWFADRSANAIAQISADGQIKEFPIPTVDAFPDGLAFDAKGDVWFAEGHRNRVARLTPSGTFDDWQLPGSHLSPYQVLIGSDSRIWIGSVAALLQLDSKQTYSRSTVFSYQMQK